MKIILEKKVGILQAKEMDIGTVDPTPIKSAKEKLIITKGNAKFNAAKAVSPKIRPTNNPSISPNSEAASMLTIPGIAAMKNNFIGDVFVNNTFESILSLPIYPSYCPFPAFAYGSSG